MSGFGKKFLSAFVDVSEDEQKIPEKPVTPPPPIIEARANTPAPAINSSKFKQYFDKLFNEANLPGPDYYEFSKMIEAMNSIPDEKARYSAAFAGLNVQGLDKQKLLSTAAEYIKLLDTDAANFNSTIDVALQEKVLAKKKEIEDKAARIKELSQEITDLNNKIAVLNNEIKENEEKIQANSGGYHAESENAKNKILQDIEKIKQHIQ